MQPYCLHPRNRFLVERGALCVMGLIVRDALCVIGLLVRGSLRVADCFEREGDPCLTTYPRAPCFPLTALTMFTENKTKQEP